MPLLGKIVVIKRNGTDGTEFPLTASCLFGRKLDCDIRIQLPQVSKEHCRIEFNENKELILTNLSSVNPTCINGEILQQSERLKHGDLITIIDRSFRFEYPPAPTPKKKRLSTPGKGETVKVLQDQQVKSTPGTTEKKSEHTTDTCLKDGSNLPVCMDQSLGDQQSKASMDSTLSPFSDLYNMVKRDLATKTVWKSSSLSNTPLSRPSVDKQEIEEVSSENVKPMTPKSAQKKRRSSTVKSLEGVQTENLSAQVKTATPVVQGMQMRHSEGISMPVSQKKTSQTTPQKFTADQVAQQIAIKSPSTKSPKARRSSTSQTPEKQTISQNPSELEESEEVKVKQATRTSPRANAGKRFQVPDVLEAEATPTSDGAGNRQASSKKHKCDDLPLPVPKRKRVSFGGQLSPELFDKGLPPNSPLRRGATPGRRSLGFTKKSHSLLRRASTIGLMGYQLEEDIAESPAKNRSPKRAPSPAKGLKTPSPAKGLKTPSPAKKSPSPKAKTLSPKYSKTPLPSSNSQTPKSSRRQSNASVKSPSPSEEFLLKTPITHGRFSVSRISTPSPDSVHKKETKEESVPVVEDPWKCVTPRATLRRSGMKASARKTPKSVLKSAFDVVRSRRSGASRANLKVVSSWADIVKFGQAKPQMEFGAKTTANKRTAVKQTKVTNPKTPAHRLIDHTSTGHADSPASIVVGKAYLRSTKLVGAAPKVVCNVALFKKDLKMDEDLTGVSDIFKTPANSRRKSAFTKTNVCPATPLVGEMTEISVMNTPEESGEMVVSPMNVASTAKLGRYNSEAVSRLLQDDQDGSLIEEMDDSVGLCPSEVSTVLDMPSKNQTKSKKAAPVGTPQHKPTPKECLTGVKRLMRTPKQKAEPIEDLRGKLLKTPKEPKLLQEVSFEGVKELLNTPEQKGTPLAEELSGLERLKTPKVTINSPVVCAVSLKRLTKTLMDKTQQEEDLTGVKQLMKTPKQKEDLKQPVEEDLTGIQEMMKTPKNLVGVKSLFQTPKKKGEPVGNDFGIDNLMKTPTQKNGVIEDSVMVEELENCSSGALLVEDACMESKEKANICLDGDVKNDTEEAETSCQEVKEEQTNVSTSAKKTRCGTRVRMAQKSQKIQEHQVDSLPAAAAGVQEETTADSAKSVSTLRGRRGKSAIEVFENVLVQSPAGKSNKGRNTEEHVEAPKSSQTSAGDEQVALKPRRGRKVEQDVEDLQVDPVISMKSLAPVRGKRGRKGKHVSENPQEPEPLVEASVEEVGVASKSAELQPSAETETPVKTRARRGRKEPTVAAEEETSDTKTADAVVVESAAENTRRGRSTKKELLKTSQVMESLETTPIVVESDYVDSKLPKSTEAQLAADTKDPVKANSKPRRGRPTKKKIPVTAQVEEISKHSLDSEVLPEEHTEVPVKSRRGRKVNPVALNNQSVVDEHSAGPHPVESPCKPEAPTVKSDRGARNKRLKPQAEDAPNDHAKYVITTAAPTEEPAEKPVVLNVRRGRMTKCPKAQVLDDSQEAAQDKPSIDSEPIQQLETPTVRSARGKCTAAVKDESEAPVKRGRRAATVEVPPPVVKSSRSRKAAAKSEPEEVTADATKMVAPVKETYNETKVLVSVTNETPLTQADSGVVAKGGRGRITKKAKVSTKNTSVNEAEETAVEEPQLKKKDEATDKEDPLVAEIKTSVKGRKGRGAKKQDLEMEKPAAEENTLPVRRGRAAAQVLSQNKEVATCPKRGQKRKDMETVAEETVDTESLPKRKRGKGAGAETETVTAVTSKGRRTAAKKAEETSEVEAEEAPKKGEKPIRGRRKVTLEDVPSQAEDPVSETATRRGTRGQKKAEANVPTAPVRRSRRK
ncbi:proliferation marker protein Ki-67 isoform X2 [Tachysurus ichikawai]